MILQDLSWDAYVDKTAAQNDAFRRAICLDEPGDPALVGQLAMSDAVQAMGPAFGRSCLDGIGRFDAFETHEDPEGWRRIGCLEVAGRAVWFRIEMTDLQGTGLDHDAAGRLVDAGRTLHVFFAADRPFW